ncbi:MAG: hypothetical protein II835_04375, partial [Fibrobacter sp.]|nr:hypothetical protein [Fibrobacter sp.]
TDSRDGNKYRTHRFCSNNWMVQELRYVPQKPGCKSYPHRDYEDYKVENGGLKYDNFSAKNCSICPEGWHIPTELDVERLSKCEEDRSIWDKANPTKNGKGIVKFYLDYNQEHSFGYFYLAGKAFGYDERGNQYPETVRCVQDDNRKIPHTEGSFTDKRDGKKYKTITVGGKTWFAQNLDYWTDSSFCAGMSAIPFYKVQIIAEYPAKEFVSHRLWGAPNCRKTFTKEYYDEEEVGEKKVIKEFLGRKVEAYEPVYQKVKKKYQYKPNPDDQVYGRYYSREEALKVCPVGWHLSTRKDWLDLRSSSGDVDLEDSKYRYGSKNHINFSALPLGYLGKRYAGERSNIGGDPRLNSDEQGIVGDYYVVYWRMDDEVGPFVIKNVFNSGDEQRLLSHIYENKKIYAPVRCVKDD